MLKKYSILFLLFACVFACRGAQYSDLTDEDAGQLIYDKYTGEVFVFEKTVSVKGYDRWQCSPFRSNTVRQLQPDRCTVMNYLVDDLTPDIVVTELVYWYAQSRARSLRPAALAYKRIAKKMNSPETNALLEFYARLDTQIAVVDRAVIEYCYEIGKLKEKEKRKEKERRKRSKNSVSIFRCQNQNQNQSSDIDRDLMDMANSKLKGTLSSFQGVDQIMNQVKNKNFFAAYCMYLRYRTEMLSAIRRVPYEIRKDFTRELELKREEIRTQFCQERNGNKVRESGYKSLFPNRHGRWEYAPPTDSREMKAAVDSCYSAWQKKHTVSRFSEFADWGNAMLEVLQMIRSHSLEKEFDDALSKYQKNHNN